MYSILFMLDPHQNFRTHPGVEASLRSLGEVVEKNLWLVTTDQGWRRPAVAAIRSCRHGPIPSADTWPSGKGWGSQIPHPELRPDLEVGLADVAFQTSLQKQGPCGKKICEGQGWPTSWQKGPRFERQPTIHNSFLPTQQFCIHTVRLVLTTYYNTVQYLTIDFWVYSINTALYLISEPSRSDLSSMVVSCIVLHIGFDFTHNNSIYSTVSLVNNFKSLQPLLYCKYSLLQPRYSLHRGVMELADP